jgi:lysyl-tRNA synthetase, class II
MDVAVRAVSARGGLAQARPPAGVRWIGRLVLLTGLLDVAAVVLRPGRERLHLMTEFLPLAGVQTARSITAAVGLLLMYLGFRLRRQTRAAWVVATALASLSVALNLLKGLDVDAAALSGVLLAILIANRRSFVGVTHPLSRWWALAALAGFGAAGFLIGLAEIAVRANRLVPGQPKRLWFVHVAYEMVGLDGPLRFTSPPAHDAVSITTSIMGLLAAGTALVLLLRPRPRPPGQSASDRQGIRDLLRQHGQQDSLGYFALRADKSVVWSLTRKAAIAYRVVAGVSLASGDPIGDPEAWPGAVCAWLADCRRHGWTPAVLGCSERAGRLYGRHGLDAIELGDEAIVDTADFTLEGRAMRAVRQAVARVERAGYVCQIARVQDLSPTVVAEAARSARQMRGSDIERGFSMALSRVGDPEDEDCVLVLARDSDGRLRGLLQFVPWGSDGLSLDIMHRDRSAENGLIEFMVVSAVRRAANLGIGRLSLNFAVLRSTLERGDRLGAGPVLRVWCRLALIASRFWQIESLYRANAKYQPRWEPRYLCFPTMRDLPRIGLAALRAEAFIVLPRSLARPWRAASPVWSDLDANPRVQQAAPWS